MEQRSLGETFTALEERYREGEDVPWSRAADRWFCSNVWFSFQLLFYKT